MKFPFQAHIITEFGGTTYSRARTMEEAITKALAYKDSTALSGTKIKIARRWVTDTKGNELWFQNS